MEEMNMEYKKTQYADPENNWDYRAISVKIYENGRIKEIVFYTLIENGKSSKGIEIFSGENYIVDSTKRSHSRRYNIENLPEKYQPYIKNLIDEYNKIKWSMKKCVNSN